MEASLAKRRLGVKVLRRFMTIKKAGIFYDLGCCFYLVGDSKIKRTKSLFGEYLGEYISFRAALKILCCLSFSVQNWQLKKFEKTSLHLVQFKRYKNNEKPCIRNIKNAFFQKSDLIINSKQAFLNLVPISMIPVADSRLSCRKVTAWSKPNWLKFPSPIGMS